MPEFIFAMIIGFVVETIRVSVRKRREPKPKPLCADCFHAHVQYTANARRAISCTYGGAVRAMKLDVLYCTDYRTRNAPRPRLIGFVQEGAPGERECQPASKAPCSDARLVALGRSGGLERVSFSALMAVLTDVTSGVLLHGLRAFRSRFDDCWPEGAP
jgi:hypothetical protein